MQASNPHSRSHFFRFISSACLIAATFGSWISSASAFHTGSIEVKVVDASHNQLPSYHHRGGLYVMGRHHQRYMIEVTNHGSSRMEVVLTVDGRDVINGKPGAYHHRGYVIDPYEKITVEGFRRSASEVATFRFTTPGDSYASRVGAGANVGVIGVAAFTERTVYRPQPRAHVYAEEADDLEGGYGDRYESQSARSGGAELGTSAPSPSAKRRMSRSRRPHPRSEIGTRYGERRHSASHETSFIRASSSPSMTMMITYDSESGLRRRGVIYRESSYGPTAFSAEHSYAPPPPGY